MKNQTQSNKAVVATCLLIVTALASGCSNKDQTGPIAVPKPPQLGQAGKQPEKPVQKAVSSAAKLAPVPPGNQFDFSNKKDPFKPDVAVKVVTDSQSAENKKQRSMSGLPIHSFDVSQFRLIGIVTGNKENQAMVVDPNGKGYVLKSGMTIGKNEGRIMSITSGGVDVVEQFKDDNGRLRKENIRITLPKKQ